MFLNLNVGYTVNVNLMLNLNNVATSYNKFKVKKFKKLQIKQHLKFMEQIFSFI